MARAFSEEMRSLESAYQAGGYTTAVLRALEGLPPGTLKMVDGQFTFTPRATSEPTTRSKSARVRHLQRRALVALVLGGGGALVPERPLVEPHPGYPADFGGHA